MKPDCASINWANKFHELASAAFQMDMAGPKDKKLREIGRYFLAQMLQGGMVNYSKQLFTKAGWSETGVHIYTV
jgi:hypothetical protein